MNKTSKIVGGVLVVGVWSLGMWGCGSRPAMDAEAGAPAPDTQASMKAEPVSVDLSSVSGVKLQGTASAEMGGPASYTLALITSASGLPAAVSEQGLEVDFEKQDVVLVGMGEQPTSGYGVEITGVQQVGETLFVQASFSQPGEMAAQVITTPWSAAAIAKRDSGVTLRSDFD